MEVIWGDDMEYPYIDTELVHCMCSVRQHVGHCYAISLHKPQSSRVDPRPELELGCRHSLSTWRHSCDPAGRHVSAGMPLPMWSRATSKWTLLESCACGRYREGPRPFRRMPSSRLSYGGTVPLFLLSRSLSHLILFFPLPRHRRPSRPSTAAARPFIPFPP